MRTIGACFGLACGSGVPVELPSWIRHRKSGQRRYVRCIVQPQLGKLWTLCAYHLEPFLKLCFLFRTERQSNAFPCDSFVARVAVTERVDDAWWGVDLGNTIRVRSVRLQNRADCCPWRLEGINIYLGEHGNTNHRFIENSMVAHDIAVPQTTPLLIPINATGRYLFVRKLTAGGYYSGLSLCEIEVFGEANA